MLLPSFRISTSAMPLALFRSLRCLVVALLARTLLLFAPEPAFFHFAGLLAFLLRLLSFLFLRLGFLRLWLLLLLLALPGKAARWLLRFLILLQIPFLFRPAVALLPAFLLFILSVILLFTIFLASLFFS